ncbi:hypothetical protein [Saccharothrix sp. ST-888]|uniref:hypothetical protein n=1 Tax=Saccharothrix sp. ST-888 TaxID=1427391 RepID=UPI0012E0998E|nr:hypothetical protein [Saccharothrix sp. ST-888]
MDSLRAFASQVRGLLGEFQTSADGNRTHGQSGVGTGAFGDFAEAQALHSRYEDMRNGLRDVLNAIQDAIDEAQRKADLTANNYEEQEQETSRSLRVNGDGWSVGSTSAPVSQAGYNSRTAASSSGGSVGSSKASSGSGDPQPTW